MNYFNTNLYETKREIIKDLMYKSKDIVLPEVKDIYKTWIDNNDDYAVTSKVKEEIAKILKDEGFIEDYTIDGEGVQKNITLTLKYKNKERVITGLKRISKPGLRVYAGKDELPTVLNGLGIAIISTSKGIMTDKEARAKNIGGEVLAYIW